MGGNSFRAGSLSSAALRLPQRRDRESNHACAVRAAKVVKLVTSRPHCYSHASGQKNVTAQLQLSELLVPGEKEEERRFEFGGRTRPEKCTAKPRRAPRIFRISSCIQIWLGARFRRGIFRAETKAGYRAQIQNWTLRLKAKSEGAQHWADIGISGIELKAKEYCLSTRQERDHLPPFPTYRVIIQGKSSLMPASCLLLQLVSLLRRRILSGRVVSAY